MIGMNRRSRFFAALFAMAALAFAQLALPAQACPHLAQMAADESASTQGMPCQGHCVESAKSFDAVKPVPAAPAVVVAPIFRLVAIARARVTVPIASGTFAGPAPPFPRSTVLRI